MWHISHFFPIVLLWLLANSKHILKTKNMDITLELIRKKVIDLSQARWLGKANLLANKPSRWFPWISQSEEHCFSYSHIHQPLIQGSYSGRKNYLMMKVSTREFVKEENTKYKIININVYWIRKFLQKINIFCIVFILLLLIQRNSTTYPSRVKLIKLFQALELAIT